MDEQKSSFYKNLSFWNLIFFIALTIAGLLVTKCLQDRVEKLEIENRAQTFRPKIELKNTPKISRIIFTRDTNWIRPRFDYNKNVAKNDSVDEVIMNLHANFSFTIFNNSEHIADMAAFLFFTNNSPLSETINELFENNTKESAKEEVYEEIIQLDNQDTSTFNFDNRKIGIDNTGIFYIHFVVFYYNQFNDLFESYFIYKATMGKMPVYKIYFHPKIDVAKYMRLVMKDRFIKIEPHNKFTHYLNEEKLLMIDEIIIKMTNKHDFTKEQGEEFLKKK